MLSTRSLLLFLALLVVALPMEALAGKKPPKWVRERPVEPDYYIGIGVASIEKGKTEHIKVAKKNGLNDLVSEIQVSISGNSVLRQFENNNQFIEAYEAETSTSVRQNIEGYELVDSWHDKESYWVYYRLSRVEYQRRKKARIDKAVSEAKAAYESAMQLQKEGELMGALSGYLTGLEAVKWYLEEDLTTFVLEQGRVDVGAALFTAVQDIVGRIRIVPEKDLLRAKVSGGIPGQTTLKTWYQQEDGTEVPARGIALKLFFSRGEGDLTERVKTNPSGEARFSVARINSKSPIQEITIALDIDGVLDKRDGLIAQMVRAKMTPASTRIPVRVAPLVAYFRNDEKALGKAAARPVIGKGIREALSEMSFRFTEFLEEADVVIDLKSVAVEGEYLSDHDVYKVYLDLDIALLDPTTGTKLYFKHFGQERGMQISSYEKALDEARDQILQRFREEVMPEIDAVQL